MASLRPALDIVGFAKVLGTIVVGHFRRSEGLALVCSETMIEDSIYCTYAHHQSRSYTDRTSSVPTYHYVDTTTRTCQIGTKGILRLTGSHVGNDSQLLAGFDKVNKFLLVTPTSPCVAFLIELAEIIQIINVVT